MTTSSLPVFVPAGHERHHPALDLSDGLPGFTHLEVPSRVDAVLDGLRQVATCRVEDTDGYGVEAAAATLHDADYLAFLRTLCESLDDDEQYVPSIFHPGLAEAPVRFRGGMYCHDIGSPVGRGTWAAALASAHAALAAADAVAAGAREAVALCRPPGHHAGRRRYGGYCFLNNACLAARRLAPLGRAAVLDIDYHLGDGSLEFASASLPYFSLHADPVASFPYIARAALELPAASGALLTLAPGIHAAGYLNALAGLLENLRASTPAAVVLSLGFDTLATDYIQDAPVGLAVDDYRSVGEAVGRLDRPVAVVLEGGYQRDALGPAAAAFFSGFLGSRGGA